MWQRAAARCRLHEYNGGGRGVRALTIDAHGGLDQLRYRDDVAMPDARRARKCARAPARRRAQPARSLHARRPSRRDDHAALGDGRGRHGRHRSGERRRPRGDAAGDRVVINPGISCRDLRVLPARRAFALHALPAPRRAPAGDLRRVRGGAGDQRGAHPGGRAATSWRPPSRSRRSPPGGCA